MEQKYRPLYLLLLLASIILVSMGAQAGSSKTKSTPHTTSSQQQVVKTISIGDDTNEPSENIVAQRRVFEETRRKLNPLFLEEQAAINAIYADKTKSGAVKLLEITKIRETYRQKIHALIQERNIKLQRILSQNRQK